MFCCWNLSSQVIYSYGNVQKLNVVEDVFKCGLCLCVSFIKCIWYELMCVSQQQISAGEPDDQQVRMKSLESKNH